MEIISILLSAVTIVLVALVFVHSRKPPEKRDDQAMTMLNQNLQGLQQRLDESSRAMQRTLHTQLSESTKIVRDVTERLTKLDETNRQVVSFAEQLRKLEDVLKNPKQRGVFGEYYLETLLAKVFQPNQFQMQYKFKDGVIVDAALFFGEKIIPIDSKFSLENYNRIVEENDPTERGKLEKVFKQDLRNRIDETAKYIRPEEGTLEFAFMFIPAEGIFYDLLVNKVGAIKVNTRDLLDYAAHEKRVHIVSPTTFYVTLQSLVVGMKAYTIQESTKQIIKNVGVLGKHLKAYDDYFQRLGNNLETTVNAYNLASKELGKIDKDVMRIGGESIEHEIAALPKPEENE